MSTERERVERAQQGDHDALVELLIPLVEELSRRIAVPIAKRSLVSVDDIIQQAFIDAFVDVDRFEYRGRNSFGAWVGRIAQSKLVDTLRALSSDRRGGAARTHSLAVLAKSTATWVEMDLVDHATGDPRDCAALAELQDKIRSAVDRLADPGRTVLRECSLEGRSVRDVALELGKSPGAVSMIRKRAMEEVAWHLGPPTSYLSAVS